MFETVERAKEIKGRAERTARAFGSAVRRAAPNAASRRRDAHTNANANANAAAEHGDEGASRHGASFTVSAAARPQDHVRAVLGRGCFAAIIPGNSAAEYVVTSGLYNFLNIYSTLLIVRLILTWFPNPPRVLVEPLATLCDPYLGLFRGIIPPLGGSLDFSPILGFVTLNFLTNAAAALPAERHTVATGKRRTLVSAAKDCVGSAFFINQNQDQKKQI